MPKLLLTGPLPERRNTGPGHGRAERLALLVQPGDLDQPAKLHAERSKEAQRFLSLLEEPVQYRQPIHCRACTKRVKNLPGRLLAAAADQLVHVDGLDDLGWTRVDRQLGKFLVQQAHVR